MLEIYNKLRSVPEEAQKPILAGRLKGKTDINPMWRIKMLTEVFGEVGFGWYTEIIDQWLEKGQNNEVSAFVKINLYIKKDGEWSRPIIGIGGAQFVSAEKAGYYTDDECYKKAYTDAISVACKSLGMAADIYWKSDSSKYDKPNIQAQPKPKPNPNPQPAAPEPNSDLIVALQEVKEAQTVDDLSNIKSRWRAAFGNNEEFASALLARYNAIINK